MASLRLLPVRLRRASVRSDGFTLVELIIVMLILGIILGGLTTSFISGTQTSANLNNEFQAEVQAVRAVDHIRRDVRCASAITPTGSASSITVTLPASCLIGSGQVSWCTVGSGNQYSLYRKVGSSCDATGALVIGNVTTASVFVTPRTSGQTTSAKSWSPIRRRARQPPALREPVWPATPVGR